MTCAQPRTKTRTSISRNICCLTSGFQILYAVEQLSSICLKDKLKKKSSHTYQTHDPPSPCDVVGELPCGSHPTAPTCVVWRWNLKDSPWQERVLNRLVFPLPATRNYSCLGLHSYHCGEFCCDFRGVCVSLWPPAPGFSWFLVFPLTW